MRTRAKVLLCSIAAGLLMILAASVALASVDVHAIGRNNPKQAANYCLPWFNFSETYVDGVVLGVAVGAKKAEAIQAAESAGMTVDPGGWGDSRAGGVSLYDRQALLTAMSGQPFLTFYDEADLRRGMTIRFRGDRVASVTVYYINTEAI